LRGVLARRAEKAGRLGGSEKKVKAKEEKRKKKNAKEDVPSQRNDVLQSRRTRKRENTKTPGVRSAREPRSRGRTHQEKREILTYVPGKGLLLQRTNGKKREMQTQKKNQCRRNRTGWGRLDEWGD